MLGKLFDLVVRELRPFLPLEPGLLKSEGHLRRLQALALVILQVPPFGGLPLEVGIDQGLGLVWGLYTSRSRVLCSRYIHSFSTIGDQ